MKRRNFLLTALFASSLIFGVNAAEEITRHKSLCNKKFLRLHDNMRKLWEDHIQWTRNYIISAIANLADQGPVAQRLLQNQDDMGDLFKPYYGKKIGNRLTKLLKEHILIAVDIIADAIANNIPKFNEDYEKWQKNARRIAEFLADKNPNWSKKELKEILYEHLDFTAGEVSSRLQADWEADIEFYDKGHIHILKLADILSNGIVKQFPDKF